MFIMQLVKEQACVMHDLPNVKSLLMLFQKAINFLFIIQKKKILRNNSRASFTGSTVQRYKTS